MFTKLVKTIHKVLLDDGFHLVGTSADSKATDDILTSLPSDWDSSDDVWVLAYRAPNEQKKSLAVLKALKVGETLEVHMSTGDTDENGLSCELVLKEFVDEDGELDVIAVRRRVVDKLTNPFKEGNTSSKTQSDTKKDNKNSRPSERKPPVDLRDYSRGGQRMGGHPAGFGYGSNDLNPQFGAFGGPAGMGGLGGMGGMGGMRGTIPPGARYDPIGPGDTYRPRGNNPDWDVASAEPDPDELPPPGYNNMFM
ncbi:hypothetical protein, variant 2 [Sphaeroforma arctica JP610]|uniref:PI31 proteasome regulator N-terminal domain-containing protein n=1 Tax=Sphaeroforma arctica JP610 TaxID=667725 RepID=A0A0L0GDQ4_9EUKA|nr:hypothetical protein, variant 2 [Sphaeroforma arctica JP610]KNC87016.1 hypothetical protein, variant 2 [Sphaeroforma arctica JP610]|eukprot:XP_014160918.1 hypothetical protein, variant 2 [Sphaeroforma arctica JP610]